MTKNLRLGSGYIISDKLTNIEEFTNNLNICLNSTDFYIQLRLKLNANESLESVLKSILKNVDSTKLNRLLLNSGNSEELDNSLELVRLIGLGGLHLTSNVLLNYKKLDKLVESNKDLIWAGSCHDAKEIVICNAKELDFIVISPVLPSSSCPSDYTLGWENFGLLAKVSHFPVYALGGLSFDHLKEVELAGGKGVAAIQSFWQLHKF